MKVGFVLECSKGGPDAIIYPKLAKEFCDAIQETQAKTMSGKHNLMAEGAAVTQLLLDEDECDYVFIIWDRMPKRGGTGKCADDTQAMEQSLVAVGVNLERVILCCIKDMLESWMIGDGAAITAYFQSLAPSHKLKAFPDYKSEVEQMDPEEKLWRYNKRYDKFSDNVKIIEYIDDWDKIAKRNNSFGHFKQRVEEICN